MKVIPLVVGACLFTTGALAQSVPEMQKMADEFAAAFNKGDIATVASQYKDDAVVFPPGGDMVKGKQSDPVALDRSNKGHPDRQLQGNRRTITRPRRCSRTRLYTG